MNQKKKHLSNGAKDFISKLLTKKPEDRMDWIQVQSHPWLIENYKIYLEKRKQQIAAEQQQQTAGLSASNLNNSSSPAPSSQNSSSENPNTSQN